MTKEEKELVIKDLCGRLPYNCMISIAEGGIDGIQWADVTLNSYLFHLIMEEDAWEYVKPYLRPMSSMTEGEKKEYHKTFRIEAYGHGYAYVESAHSFDWLNANHFDYRGLIPAGLANAAPEGMYIN